MSVIVSSETVAVSSGVTSTGLDVVGSGVLSILNGGLAYKTTVSGGSAVVSHGGVMLVCTVADGGSVTVLNGGFAQAVTVETGGRYTVSSGGTAHKSVVSSGGTQIIQSDVFAASATVLDGGELHVSKGAYADAASVSTGGLMCLSSGGMANNARICGSADVKGGAELNGASILDGGQVAIRAKGYAGAIEVGPGGILTVFSGGTAADVRENGGWVEVPNGAAVTFAANAFSGLLLDDGDRATVHSGTTALDLEVKSGGVLHVFSGGTLGGTMTFESGATVSADGGSVVDFDLTRTSAGAESLLNDLSIVRGNPLYTLTVNAASDAELSCGVYRYALAGRADGFNGTISVSLESGGEPESISVGDIFFIGETSYMLGILDSVLTLTVTVPDLIPPVVSDVQASVMAPTNQDVTVTAVFSDNAALAASLYRIGADGEWLEYADGVTVAENTTVSFRAVDEAGNESEIVSFEVANIDKAAPVIALSGDNQTPLREASLTASTEEGLDIFYSADGATWSLYAGGIAVAANGTYSFRSTDAAGNTGTAEIVFANILPVAPENLIGAEDRVSWDPNGAPGYIVEYSTDDFLHVLRIAATTAAVDLFDLAAGTYRWRVRAEDRDVWSTGADIVSGGGSDAPEVVRSNADGCGDVFFASVAGTWDWDFAFAQHVGSVNDWEGTNEFVLVAGKGRIRDLFIGSDDPNVLCLTDGGNGEALFLDDVFTELPEDLEAHQARIANIREIRAGAGADVIDLTSRRFEYTGGGMTVRGGDGGDVIWANKGDNLLFGDAGSDIIAGASGSDVIAGGIGDDAMQGGGGDDIFAFCENWGSDLVKQLASGSVTLWFASGSIANWDAESTTYTDGENCVRVSGVSADGITLKFGDDGSERYADLSAMGAFDAFTSKTIFDETGNAAIAGL